MRKSLVVCLITTIGIGGCIHTEPKIFGVPQTTWAHMSEAERQAVIQGYNEQRRLEIEGENRRQATKEANAPLNSLITVLGNSLERQDFTSKNKHKHVTPSFSEMPIMPPIPTIPEPAFSPGDCKEICENRGGVTYCEQKCEHHERRTTSSLSFRK